MVILESFAATGAQKKEGFLSFSLRTPLCHAMLYCAPPTTQQLIKCSVVDYYLFFCCSAFPFQHHSGSTIDLR